MKQLSSPQQQYQAIHNYVAIYKPLNMGMTILTGKDTLNFLHRITTNSIKNLQPNQIIQTIFTTEKGRTIDCVAVLHQGQQQLLVGSQQQQTKLSQWIDKYVILDDVHVQDCKNLVLYKVFGKQRHDLIEHLLEHGDFSDNSMVFVDDVWFCKWPHEYWLLVEPNKWSELLKKIHDCDICQNLCFISEAVYEAYRIEQGIPTAPNEINEENNPHEMGLLAQVDFDKGCYIGQEVIARLDTYDKVKKKLRGVIASAAIAPQDVVRDQEREIGKITSCAISPEYNHVALAYIQRKYWDLQEVFIQHKDQMISAQLITLPFHDSLRDSN